ncbi:transposase [Mariniflexile sp. HMF6888]|uniref:transposase n=1 Tax=Mariniflexile sp. HMF6888 TaxID=3373086 RepID=UPI0037AD0174
MFRQTPIQKIDSRTIAEQNPNKTLGDATKAKRQSTVEPVFGILTQFLGLRKVNTIGIRQANKCMQLSAIAYNLKKYLKFIDKHSKSGATSLSYVRFAFKAIIQYILRLFKPLNFREQAI